jgi:D-beta-D-heptose 7-phosphate kinase/D-beta-D-heptose 1-phosphate adenosyltransferase
LKVTGSEKRLPLPDLVACLQQERANGRTVVFTNGCYDILHVGHLDLLQRTAALGDLVVVGLNSDGSVRRLKGDSRPFVPFEDRADLLAGLEPVDFVIGFEEDTPERLMEAIRPDIMVKGGDYSPETLPEKDTADRIGCRIEIVPFREGRSTTGLVDRIIRAIADR